MTSELCIVLSVADSPCILSCTYCSRISPGRFHVALPWSSCTLALLFMHFDNNLWPGALEREKGFMDWHDQLILSKENIQPHISSRAAASSSLHICAYNSYEIVGNYLMLTLVKIMLIFMHHIFFQSCILLWLWISQCRGQRSDISSIWICAGFVLISQMHL